MGMRRRPVAPSEAKCGSLKKPRPKEPGGIVTNTVHLGDCLDELRRLPTASVDLVFADPPYNLQLATELLRPNNTRVDGVDDEWDKFASFEEYDRFTRAWLAECRRILKPDGALWLIGSYHNVFRLGVALQDQGYWILNDVVWRKVNPMPNFRGRRFTNAHETLIWAARDRKSRYTFNYEGLKSGNDDVQMRSDWLFPICSGPERLKDDGGRKAHPTQKPEALLHRILMASTNSGDVVLDPFFGTGTTGAVAEKLGRRWIGIERDPDYAKAAEERIAKVAQLPESALHAIKSKRAEPRVPFGTIIEMGMLRAGSPLYDERRRVRAEIKADGTLAVPGSRGSIHRLGAIVQGKQACNGWTYWHYENNGKLTPIDALREKAKARLGLSDELESRPSIIAAE